MKTSGMHEAFGGRGVGRKRAENQGSKKRAEKFHERKSSGVTRSREEAGSLTEASPAILNEWRVSLETRFRGSSRITVFRQRQKKPPVLRPEALRKTGN